MARSLLLFALLIVSSCNDKHPEIDQTSGQPQYLRRTNADTVIVFVHGVFGGSIGTWTNSETHAYWPQLLLDDATFKPSDIYVYSYPSPYLNQSYTVDELIEHARLIFDNDEIFKKHKRVIFVCHSMGGLVIRGLLKRYQMYAPQVPLIYFYSTPTAGAHIAQLAKFLSHNPQLHAMVPSQSDNYVDNLQRDWRALPYHVKSKCAYEDLDTYGIRIVDQQSATSLCDGPVDPMDRSHIEIVKPRDRSDTPYIAFRQAFMNEAVPAPPAQQTTVGLLNTARSVEVDCGQTRDDDAKIPPPIELKPEQKVLDVIASLQESSNLKEGKAESKGLDGLNAKVHYRLIGPDRVANGNCPAKGSGVILISFVVSQPASLETAEIVPLDKETMNLALLSKPGAIKIPETASIQPIEAANNRNASVLVFPSRKLELKNRDAELRYAK